MKKMFLILTIAVFGCGAVRAGMPLQIGIAGESAQLFSAEKAITGLRLNLPYGENDEMTGIDLGIASGGGTIRGVRLNLMNLSSVRSEGLEFGAINMDAAGKGLQFGGINVVDGEFTGWQAGIFNHAGEMHGFQLGVINHATSLHGLQLGLLNIVRTGHVTMFPFIGWGF